MGAYSASARPWLHRYPILAIISGCAIACHAGGEPAEQKSLQIAPSFEEDRSDTSERYVWRSSETAVSLKAGGELVIQWRSGGESHISFTGANGRSKPRGEVASGSKTIYYIGPPRAWRSASHFERVRYSAIYPGIDVVFVTAGNRLEYNFEIAPYADPAVIRVHYQGSSLELTRGGDLEMHTGHAIVTQRRPIAFQNVRGQRRPVACDYLLKGDREVGLGLQTYDHAEALFIDPVLDFSTYLGGSGFDAVYAAATDAQGNLYVAGETSSGSITNPSSAARSSRNAFVAKLNSAGTQVLYTVYLGGSAYDSGRGIALDPSGNIYLTGVTESSNFPVTAGALLTQASGAQYAFVAKFSPSFVLQYSTYLGGGTADFGLAIAVDSTGAAYVAGQTESPSFPVSTGAFQTAYQDTPAAAKPPGGCCGWVPE